jgi:hypothetical protein
MAFLVRLLRNKHLAWIALRDAIPPVRWWPEGDFPAALLRDWSDPNSDASLFKIDDTDRDLPSVLRAIAGRGDKEKNLLLISEEVVTRAGLEPECTPGNCDAGDISVKLRHHDLKRLTASRLQVLLASLQRGLKEHKVSPMALPRPYWEKS